MFIYSYEYTLIFITIYYLFSLYATLRGSYDAHFTDEETEETHYFHMRQWS